MTTIVAIVEGHGEVAAVPELLRRLAGWISPLEYVHVATPIRTAKSKFLNDPEEFSRKLQLAALKAGDAGWVLVLLDADDDCPVELASHIRRRAAACINEAILSVVVANREFEAWFIAAAASLQGCRSFMQVHIDVPDPDQPRDAKGWIARQMGAGYHEVTDQPAFCSRMSLEEAWLRSRSFRHLVAEFTRRCRNVIPP